VAADGTGAAVGSPLTSAADGAPLATAAPASLRSHRRSVEGPYAVLVAAGLAIVLLSAEWARRSAAATLWLGP
jgi:hypothetical protein